MRLGLHVLGIDAGADRAVIDAVALAAERCGFATLWSGEHAVMVDRSQSRYPYSDDGQIAVPAGADWIDPIIGLSFAAAATSSIRIATGVLLLPEHNPVLLAKQAATLDTLSGGRIPIVVGGNSGAALRRVAAWGDGWYGFNLASVQAVAERIRFLKTVCHECGREPGELRLAVALRDLRTPDVAQLADLGVDELVLVDNPPADPHVSADWVSALADRWISPPA